jgi:Fatty acid hydroxylase superfamily
LRKIGAWEIHGGVGSGRFQLGARIGQQVMSGAGWPDAVGRFRDDYRDREIPTGYSGGMHLVFTFGVGTLVLLACLAQLRQVQPLEWLTLPLALGYSNLAEYLGHRFPMHRPYRGLSLLYKRHAGQHHRFFNDRAMPIDKLRDLRAVLFPPLLVSFFFGLFGLPMWFLLAWLLSANVAWLFIATGLAYFLNYEILHLAYHLPEQHWLAQRWLVRRLRWLHRIHHDPRRMSQCNFNITYPLGDWLFGTLRRE